MCRGAPLLLVLLLAPPALARAPAGPSVDVTLSPVGAYATWAPGVRTTGYTAGLSWRFRRAHALYAVGGHASSSRHFSQATPVAIRLSPLAHRVVQPYVGVGASFLVVHGAGAASRSALRLGAELSGGVGLVLSPQLFLSAEARLQDFSLQATPLAARRLVLGSAHLGMGVRL